MMRETSRDLIRIKAEAKAFRVERAVRLREIKGQKREHAWLSSLGCYHPLAADWACSWASDRLEHSA